MNEPIELKLGMTQKKVAEILGKPDQIKKTGWKAVNCYYTNEDENIMVRFVDSEVKHIARGSKDLDWEP